MLIAVVFALWPLGRAHDVPVAMLFRDTVAPQRRLPRRRYVVAVGLAAFALAFFVVAAAFDRKIALIFIGAAVAVFGVLRLTAAGLMAFARVVPRPRVTIARIAIANIHRPGALTPTVVLSLGLGVSLLVTVLEVDANLRQQFAAALPDKAPSFYFIDIPSTQATRFADFIHGAAPTARLEQVPMLRGRIVSARGVAADDLMPKPDAAWVLQSDRGITYTGEMPAGSRLAAGRWWGEDYSGPPEVSLEKQVAAGTSS